MSKGRRSHQRSRKPRHEYPDLVWFAGRWMVRTIAPVKRIDLGNGMYGELHNETWHEPHVLQQYARQK